MKTRTTLLLTIFTFSSVCLILSSCETNAPSTITSSDGTEISFDNQGNGEIAVIFVHGWANNRTIWKDQVQFFSQKYQVINVDLPGFGESGKTRDDWSMAKFGEDVALLVQELDLQKVVLVGFSMGGPVVIEATPKIEDRVMGVVLVDILHDVNFRVPPSMQKQFRMVMMDMVKNPTKDKLITGGFFQNNVDESYEKVLTFFENAPFDEWEKILEDNMSWMNDFSTESIQAVQVPIKAINSERFPTNEESFRLYAPGFEATIIENAGHVLMWDAKDKFNQSLETYIQSFQTNP